MKQKRFAEAEQNFLIPAQTQALIWGDLVPQMILSAKIPRWWNVAPAQMHWVGLHLQYGREVLAESAFDPEVRGVVLEALAMHAAPVRTSEVSDLLEAGNVKEALDNLVRGRTTIAIAHRLSTLRKADRLVVLERGQIVEIGNHHDPFNL